MPQNGDRDTNGLGRITKIFQTATTGSAKFSRTVNVFKKQPRNSDVAVLVATSLVGSSSAMHNASISGDEREAELPNGQLQPSVDIANAEASETKREVPTIVNSTPVSSAIVSVKVAGAQEEDFAWTCGHDLAILHVKIIARGNSEVHMMRNTTTAMTFARKLTKPFGTITGEAIENEQRAVWKLCRDSNKHLIAVLGLGVIDSHYFIDMELCDNNLEQYIQTSNAEIAGIWRIMRDITDGVAFIHSHKEVHRDLKPRNSTHSSPLQVVDFQVLYSGKADCWKIADFGLSTETSLKTTRSTELARGTECYRAPELLVEPYTVSSRADIWALGCILYELFIKDKAFISDFTVREHRATRSRLSIPLDESMERQRRADLASLIQRMLHFEAKSRPTAKALSVLFGNLVSVNSEVSTLDEEHSSLAKICEPYSQDGNTNIESNTAKFSTNMPPSPIHFMLPYQRNPYFVGRDDLIIELHTRICETNTAKYNHRIAIYGTGGIGKTQIAIEYAYRYETFYKHIFWISAQDGSALLAGFQEIAKLTSCAQPSLKPEDQAKVVLGWLRQQKNWLLVLDNLDDISVAKGYLPEWSEGRHTLITTRNPFSKDIPAEGFEIPLFGSEEAIELLRIRSEVIPSEFDTGVAWEIVVELDHLPLAIEAAAAFLRKARKSLQDFLPVYCKSRNSLLRRKPGGNAEYPNSLATTFLISFNKVKEMDTGPQAASLLQLFSFLNPDGILIEFLRSGGAALSIAMRDLISDEVLFYEALEILEQFSLIRRSKGDMIVIHRLIQAVVKEDMGEAELGTWRIELGNLCDTVFPAEVKRGERVPDEIRPRCRLMSIQILYPIRDAAEIYCEKVAHTLRKVAWFLEEDGKYSDCQRLIERSITIYKRLLGDECGETLKAELCLARMHQLQGRLKDALDLGRQVLEVVQGIPGEEDSQLIPTTKTVLASTYRELGKLKEAASLEESVLEARQRVLGEEHHETLTAKNNLALTYWTMGKPVEAAAIQEHVLEAKQRILGKEHPETLIAKNNLALTYWTMGKPVEAAALQERVLHTRDRILGKEHPETLIAKNNLALTYWSMGKLVEAAAIQKHVLEARQRILGKEHPETLIAKNNIASTYQSMGKLVEAATLQENVMEARQRTLGHEHPNTLRTISHLALTKQMQNDLKTAEELGRRVLASMERILGNEHKWTLDARSNLADTFWKRGQRENAIILKQEATDGSAQALGHDHPDTLKRIKALKEWKDTSVYSNC